MFDMGTDWHIVGTGDFNGDGRTDILWRNDDGSVTDWLGLADGTFADNANNYLTHPDLSWHVAGTGDFNGDGRSDILWVNDGGLVTDWLGQADGSFVGNSDNFLKQVDASWHVAGTGNFNSASLSDVLWINSGGLVTDWLGQSNGSIDSNNFLTTVDGSWGVGGTGDFNGDGRTDILWVNEGGLVTDWLAQSDGSFVGNQNFLTQVSTLYHVVGVGDFDGDGLSDVLWRDNEGLLSEWRATGDAGFATNFSMDVSPTWEVAGTGDFNGDGRDDILWRGDDGALDVQRSETDGTFLPTSAQLWKEGLANVSAFFDELTDQIASGSPQPRYDMVSAYDMGENWAPFDQAFLDMWGFLPTVQNDPAAHFWDFLLQGDQELFQIVALDETGFESNFNGQHGSMQMLSGDLFTFDVQGTSMMGVWHPGEVSTGGPNDPIVITGGGYWTFVPVGTGFDTVGGNVVDTVSGAAGTHAGPTTPNVDFDFLTRHEGGVITHGYVPTAGHSGVTIGAGVDLGQQSAVTLRAAGVSESLITLFAPYFGLQGTAASAYLAAHPLTLSLPNATTLSNQMETYFAQQVGARYNAASALNFFDLPMNTQTAVVDLAYQYGLNLAAATPNFWNQVTHGEWAAAYNNLRDFGDAYLSRRHDEASLIQADIQSGALTTAQ